MRSRRHATIAVGAGGWTIFWFTIGLAVYLTALWVQHEVQRGFDSHLPVWVAMLIVIWFQLIDDKGFLILLGLLGLSAVYHVIV